METFFSGVMDWVQLHPLWAGVIVFVVSALESLLVVGLFVPGSVVMFGFGAMIAAGSMELVPTLILGAAGAVCGDGISYFIGRHYHQRLRVMWPFRRYPHMIARGVDFFHQHGGKSILLARFVGPVRPLIPAVAGMLDMPVRRFFAVDTLAAMLWAPAYILPGVLFGASIGVAAEIAGRLAALLIMLVALVWLSWWLVKRIARVLQRYAMPMQMRILEWSRRHRSAQPLIAALLDPNHPEARGMTVLTTLLLVASWMFLITPQHLGTTGLFNNVDLYLFNRLQDLRSPQGDRLMVIITHLGSSPVLYGFTVVMTSWLLWRRRSRAAVHWLLTVASVGLLTQVLKWYATAVRTPALETASVAHAFPSIHAALSVAVFGFLAVMIARELRSTWHWIPYSVAVLLIVPIGFSRIYLGAHWFSDVLVGWSLGLVWVALMGIAYRHHPAAPLSAGRFTPLAAAVLMLLAVSHSVRHLHQDLERYRPAQAAPVMIDRTEWLNGGWSAIGTYRDDLKGLHDQPLNVQWMGSPDQLIEHLRGQGWRRPAVADLSSLADLFNSQAGVSRLPVLPQLHHGEAQQLLLVRDLEDMPRLLALRLWTSRQHAARDDSARLWTGTVTHLYIEDRFRLFRFLRTGVDFDTALGRFAEDTRELGQRWVRRPVERDPAARFDWDGSVLLLYDPPVNSSASSSR